MIPKSYCFLLSHTVVRCSPLNGIKNGNVTYHESLSDTDTTDPLPYGSIATYMCDEHFNLTGGNQTRICGGNLTKGFWSGAAPTCNGKYSISASVIDI